MLDSAYQKDILAIANDFPIEAADLWSIDGNYERNSIGILAHDVKFQERLQELKRSEKAGFTTTFSMLPIIDTKILLDSNDFNNLKRIVELGVEDADPDNNRRRPLNNDAFFNALKRIGLSNLGITFGKDVLMYEKQPGFTDSLSVSVNRFPSVYQALENSKIDGNLLFSVANNDSVVIKWEKYFSNPKNMASFKMLQDKGYALSSFFNLIPGDDYHWNDKVRDIEEFFSHKGVQAFLLELARHVQSEDLRKGDVTALIAMGQEYYTDGDYSKLNLMIPDIQTVTFGQEEKISINNLIKKLHRTGVYENIYLPLISETHKSGRLENNFFQDPALEYVRKLGYHKDPPQILAEMSLREQASWIMQTCRAMKVLDQDCTEENFIVTLKNIMETRSNPDVLNQELFHNRNVVAFFHNEQDSLRGDRFGQRATINGIHEQRPSQVEICKSFDSISALIDTKKKFLDFCSSKSQLTIFINAHGSPQEIFLSNGLPDGRGGFSGVGNANNVTYKELAEALIKRFQSGVKDQAIIIESACMNFEFIMNVYKSIEEYNRVMLQEVPLPIAVGTSEYGQYGFGSLSSPYGSDFIENLFTHSSGYKIKLQDVISIESDSDSDIPSNISIFVPYIQEGSKHQIPFQIAEDKNSNGREQFS